MEYPYAWIGVQFEYFLQSALHSGKLQIDRRCCYGLPWASSTCFLLSSNPIFSKFNASGFRRGMVLSPLEPHGDTLLMGVHGIPQAQKVDPICHRRVCCMPYVFGTSVGAMALLSVLILFAQRVAPYVQGNKLGADHSRVVLLVLGPTPCISTTSLTISLYLKATG